MKEILITSGHKFSWKNVFATIGVCSLIFFPPTLIYLRGSQDARFAVLYSDVENQKLYCEQELTRLTTVQGHKQRAVQARPSPREKKRGIKL